MADVFSEDHNDQGGTVDITFNDLVGEGRKYNDPDALAKSYAHVESFAETLKRENAELREKLDREQANTNNQNNNSQNGQEPLPGQKPNDSEAPNKNSSNSGNDDYRSQIREEVRALNEEERAKANIDLSIARLVEVTGSEDAAAQSIRKKAQELGVTVDWLKDAASRSPNAFFTTMGINPGSQQNRSTPNPINEFRPNVDSNVKGFEYFDKLRKDDPKTYFSAANQAEMMREAKRQGADFYKR